MPRGNGRDFAASEYMFDIPGCSSAWLERLLWEQEVVGSNPITPTRNCGLTIADCGMEKMYSATSLSATPNLGNPIHQEEVVSSPEGMASPESYHLDEELRIDNCRLRNGGDFVGNKQLRPTQAAIPNHRQEVVGSAESCEVFLLGGNFMRPTDLSRFLIPNWKLRTRKGGTPAALLLTTVYSLALLGSCFSHLHVTAESRSIHVHRSGAICAERNCKRFREGPFSV